MGKEIELTSSEGPGNTILEPENGGTVVTSRHGETHETVMSGFTLRSGASYGCGWRRNRRTWRGQRRRQKTQRYLEDSPRGLGKCITVRRSKSPGDAQQMGTAH